jgi:4'-phosphopantetheinyl transferase EntD
MVVDVHELANALARLAPLGVITGARLISAADLRSLTSAEHSLVAGAVELRRIEFATGRRLLRELIGSSDSILIGPSRAPLLPSGVVGSLAHDSTVAVAAVSRDPQLVALGVDVEPTDELPDEMARVILRDDEQGIDAHLAFTLKEAAYKAWSNLGGRMLEHHDVRLQLSGSESPDVDGQGFTATVVEDGIRLTGRWTCVAGRYLAILGHRAD